MKHYTPKQLNQIRQELKTGKPVSIVAQELSTEWNRPFSGVYHKTWALSKTIRRVTGEYKGPKKRRRGMLRNITSSKKENLIVAPVSTTEEIVDKPIERQSAEIGIEVPVGAMSFIDSPSKVVVYPDHVRYYFQ